MRHNKKFNHLSRKKGHRTALLRNMACSLIEHKRISTTLAKAKALRVYVEPIITRSKEPTMHNHRQAFRYLQNKYAVKELFGAVGPAVLERPGGYCRVIRTGTRLGDNAETAIIELVDFNPDYNPNDKGAKKGRTRRSRRRRGGGGSPSGESKATAAAASESTSEAEAATAKEPDAPSAETSDAPAVATGEEVTPAEADQVTETDELKQVEGTTPEGLAQPEGGVDAAESADEEKKDS